MLPSAAYDLPATEAIQAQMQASYRVLLYEPELLSKKKSEKKISKAVIHVRACARVYARVRRGWASVPMPAYVCTCPPLCRPLDWSAPPKRVGSEMSTVRLRVPLAVLPRRDVRTAGRLVAFRGAAAAHAFVRGFFRFRWRSALGFRDQCHCCTGRVVM